MTPPLIVLIFLLVATSCLDAPPLPNIELDADSLDDARTPDVGGDPTADSISVDDSGDGGPSLLPIDEVALGYRIACARTGGDVLCWGDDSHNALTVPLEVQGRATSIKSYYSNVCATTSDDAFICWGFDGVGATINQTDVDSGVLSFDLAESHACAVNSEGDARCWGSVLDGITLAEDLIDIAEVSIRGNNGCAIDTARTSVSCWGRNVYGVGGTGAGTRLTPTEVLLPVDGTVSQIRVGERHYCAIADGVLVCWGVKARRIPWASGFGITGPLPLESSRKIVDVEMSSQSTCALDENGVVSCWGENLYGETGSGDGEVTIEITPVEIPEPVSDIVAGFDSFCAKTEVGFYCWGANSFGETDPSTSTLSIDPVAPAAQMVDAFDLGERHACAIRNNTVTCWGANWRGATTGNSQITTSAEVPLPADFVPSQISSGLRHSCVLGDRNASSEVYCWGSNENRQVGGTERIQIEPLRRPQQGNYTAVDSGGVTSCAIANGEMWCWGQNASGAIGSPDVNALFHPHEFDFGVAQQVETNVFGTTGVLLTNNELYLFGRNTFGEAMQDSGNPSIFGVPIDPSFEGVNDFCLGARHGCLVNDQSEVLCWGANEFGQGGREENASVSTPTPVLFSNGTELINMVEIACGDRHTCARNQLDEVFCWGDNRSGQFGRTTPQIPYTNRPGFPLDAISRSPVKLQVEADALHLGDGVSCVMLANQLSCWGESSFNEFGNGTVGTVKPKLLDTRSVTTQL